LDSASSSKASKASAKSKAHESHPKTAANTSGGSEAAQSSQKRRRKALARSRKVKRKLAEVGRLSIRDYERIEIMEGRLDPLFQCFWRFDSVKTVREREPRKTSSAQGKSEKKKSNTQGN